MRGNVGDPQLIGSKRLEVAPDQVGRALLPRRAARGARRLGATDAVQAQVAHEPLDGTAGHVTGTVTLGNLGSTPHHVHLAGPQHRVVVLVNPSNLSTQGLVAHAPGAGRPAAAGVSHVLGAICTPASLSVAQIGQAPHSSFLVSMYLADQRDGRSHSTATDKPTRSSGSRPPDAVLGPPTPAP